VRTRLLPVPRPADDAEALALEPAHDRVHERWMIVGHDARDREGTTPSSAVARECERLLDATWSGQNGRPATHALTRALPGAEQLS
jgi:hypothetical protein